MIRWWAFTGALVVGIPFLLMNSWESPWHSHSFWGFMAIALIVNAVNITHCIRRRKKAKTEDGALALIPGNRVVKIKDCRPGEGEVFAFHHGSLIVRGTLAAIDRWQAEGSPMDGLEHTLEKGVSCIDDGWRLDDEI